jgi:FxsC-like protein
LLALAKLTGKRLEGAGVSEEYGSGARDAAPYFFLSYAHTPRQEGDPGDPDIWVGQLFRDLCSHILQLTNLPPGVPPGFMDRELRSGADWPARVAHALATCRVFVPLYSLRYFDSEQCGKEWFAFSRRALNHAARGAGGSEAIIPALWVPVMPAYLPEAAKSIQFDHRELGDRYSTHGFYGIIKLSRYSSDYEEAVYELARRIVDVAQNTHIDPEHPARYEFTASAFGVPGRTQGGRRRLRITVVAPDLSDLPPSRSGAHYGPAARDWNPYRPESVRSLADHAADLARNLGYRPEVGDLDEHLEALLGSEETCGPGLLIVDAWATTQPECQRKLQQIDALDKPWIQVVVPWNREDAEFAGAEAMLRQSLDVALRDKIAAGRMDCRIAVNGVPNLAAFGTVLPAVVQVAARQYLRNAQAYPPAGPGIERPRLIIPVTDPPNPER